MKPFNLERALAGEPVITRKGNPARIICFDKKSLQPLVALIEVSPCHEVVAEYNADGCFYYDSNKVNRHDLFMAPKKTTYWVNVYKNISEYSGYYTGKDLFSCLESAKKFQIRNCIGAFEIEIEE